MFGARAQGGDGGSSDARIGFLLGELERHAITEHEAAALSLALAQRAGMGIVMLGSFRRALIDVLPRVVIVLRDPLATAESYWAGRGLGHDGGDWTLDRSRAIQYTSPEQARPIMVVVQGEAPWLAISTEIV